MDLHSWGEGGGVITGGGGANTREEKYFNLQSLNLTLLFIQYKARILAFSRRSRCEICSKLTVETPKYVQLMIKLKIKTQLTWLWPLYCQLWTHFTSSYSLSQLIASWGCCLLFWHFVPAGINLGKVYRGEGVYIRRWDGLIFRMSTGLHIWGGGHIIERGACRWEHINRILLYLDSQEKLSLP